VKYFLHSLRKQFVYNTNGIADGTNIYACFSGSDLPSSKWLKKVDSPCLIVSEEQTDKVLIHIVNPNVEIVDPSSDYFRSGLSREREITLKFRYPVRLVSDITKDYQALKPEAQEVIKVSGDKVTISTSNAFTHKIVFEKEWTGYNAFAERCGVIS